MNISNNIYKYNRTFTARKKEIRDADSIQRKTKEQFPMLSQSYIDKFYKAKSASRRNFDKFSAKTNEMFSRIKIMRKIEKKPEDFGLNIPDIEKNTLYAISLNGMKQLKIGNCEENAKAAVAVLFANGYYNSERVDLMYKVDFINKETGKTEDSKLYQLDHSFTITDMNKGGEKDIVIDPWLGFADSKSGAVSRFKQMYNEKDFKEAISILKILFCCSKQINFEAFNKKYDIKSGFEFVPSERYTTDFQKQKLGEYAKMMYDGILIDTKA